MMEEKGLGAAVGVPAQYGRDEAADKAGRGGQVVVAVVAASECSPKCSFHLGQGITMRGDIQPKIFRRKAVSCFERCLKILLTFGKKTFIIAAICGVVRKVMHTVKVPSRDICQRDNSVHQEY